VAGHVIPNETPTADVCRYLIRT